MLPNELIGIFYRALLPRSVGVREADPRPEPLGDVLVVPELRAVARGDGADLPLVGRQQQHDRPGHRARRLPLRHPGHEDQAGVPLYQREDYRPAPGADDRVHLEIPERRSVRPPAVGRGCSPGPGS